MVCFVSSLEILLCGEILNILQNKWEQNNSWNLLESSPTTMLYGSFHVILCNSWWLIMSIRDRQHFVGLEIKAKVVCLSHSGWGRMPILLGRTWMVGRRTDRYRLAMLSCPCRSVQGWCLSLRGCPLSPSRVCGAYLSLSRSVYLT
jgi:hypothetical protein